MSKLLVLMSTYNGSSYVREQIDSILSQGDVDLSILIRDDGSNDNTWNILETYIGHPKIEIVKGKNIGYIRSFSQLVLIATAKKEYDYYAFADQDDHWYPNKLRVALDALQKRDGGKPLLFCSNSEIIDGTGHKTGKFFVKGNPILRKGNILVNSLCQGCSMVFNKRALQLYADNPPTNTIHDRWMMMICDLMGGEIIYCSMPLFGYRIHENNAIGVPEKPKGWQALTSSLNYWFHDNKEHQFHAMAREFKEKMGKSMEEENLELLNTYVEYNVSLAHKIKLMLSEDFYPYNPTVKNILRQDIHILTNKI